MVGVEETSFPPTDHLLSSPVLSLFKAAQQQPDCCKECKLSQNLNNPHTPTYERFYELYPDQTLRGSMRSKAPLSSLRAHRLLVGCCMQLAVFNISAGSKPSGAHMCSVLHVSTQPAVLKPDTTRHSLPMLAAPWKSNLLPSGVA